MKILVLGGTRFCGDKLVQLLHTLGEDVTVSSRRPSQVSGVNNITGERNDLLPSVLGNEHFDTVFDFTAYDPQAVRLALTHVKCDRYLFISSLWVNKLDPSYQKEIPSQARSYIENKLGAEQALAASTANGAIKVALRLPILLGEGDHTGRASFYTERLEEDEGLIVVGDGENVIPFANVWDVAANLLALRNFDPSHLGKQDDGLEVIDCRAGETVTQIEFLKFLKESIGSSSEFHHASAATLQSRYPAYLDYEPFWREAELPIEGVHISELVEDSYQPFSIWVEEVTDDKKRPKPDEYVGRRAAELRFIEQEANTK